MSIPTETLLRDLERLEQSYSRFPSANDVIRDGHHSVNTYYKRFGRTWSEVENAYVRWTESGEAPVEPSRFDWRSIRGAAVE